MLLIGCSLAAVDIRPVLPLWSRIAAGKTPELRSHFATPHGRLAPPWVDRGDVRVTSGLRFDPCLPRCARGMGGRIGGVREWLEKTGSPGEPPTCGGKGEPSPTTSNGNERYAAERCCRSIARRSSGAPTLTTVSDGQGSTTCKHRVTISASGSTDATSGLAHYDFRICQTPSGPPCGGPLEVMREGCGCLVAGGFHHRSGSALDLEPRQPAQRLGQVPVPVA